MKKYEVFKGTVTTKNGLGAAEEYYRHPEKMGLVGSFDTKEEAEKCYNGVSTETRASYYGSQVGYVHEFKVLEENEYDEDGEWIGGGDTLAEEWDNPRYCRKNDIDDICGNDITEEEAKAILGRRFDEFSNKKRKDYVVIREYVDNDGNEHKEIVERS